MTEIALSDLPASTLAKFANNTEAQAALDAALSAARRFTGWPVSPVVTEELTLDGPCGQVLDLPTRNLLDIVSITENGSAVANPEWSTTGAVRKSSGASWGCRYRSIVAEIQHGYTEAEAADWRSAIVAMVGDMASSASDAPLIRKKVDDIEYQWGTEAEVALNSVSYVLESYRLHPVYFA